MQFNLRNCMRNFPDRKIAIHRILSAAPPPLQLHPFTLHRWRWCNRRWGCWPSPRIPTCSPTGTCWTPPGGTSSPYSSGEAQYCCMLDLFIRFIFSGFVCWRFVIHGIPDTCTGRRTTASTNSPPSPCSQWLSRWLAKQLALALSLAVHVMALQVALLTSIPSSPVRAGLPEDPPLLQAPHLPPVQVVFPLLPPLPPLQPPRGGGGLEA